jgi:hypothetical protein
VVSDRVLRGLNVTILGMGALALLSYILWLPRGLGLPGDFGSYGVGLDFIGYYSAAEVLSQGGDIYTLFSPYSHPPLLAWIAQPLILLDDRAAMIAWRIGQHVALLAIGALLVAMTSARIRPLVTGMLLLMLLTTAVRDEVRLGQINSYILLLVVLGLFLISRGSAQPGAVGGAAWGLAASIKVLPVGLAAYLWIRGLRERGTPAAWGAVGAIVGLLVLQLAVTPLTARYWLEVFPSVFELEHTNLDNQSISATVSRLLVPGVNLADSYPLVPTFGLEIRLFVVWTLNLVVLTTAAWMLFRSARLPQTTLVLMLEVSLVLLTIHLVSGSTWLAHLVDLSVVFTTLLAIWWLAPPGGRQSLLTPLVIVGAISLLAIHPEDWVRLVEWMGTGSPVLEWLSSCVPFFVIVGLWVWVIRLLQSHTMITRPDLHYSSNVP